VQGCAELLHSGAMFSQRGEGPAAGCEAPAQAVGGREGLLPEVRRLPGIAHLPAAARGGRGPAPPS